MPARKGGTGDILIVGSRITWNRLLAEGLIDELHLMASPTALSQGLPIFTTTADLTLLEARRFDNSNNVLLRYAAKQPPREP
ncbi:MAG TPA: dihydrofolate reductase family protein [Arthrobacter sp.]|nr:dihydrofolate reductase family protein [Arthrobacter sp.]